MMNSIKEKLYKEPTLIIKILEHFGFYNPILKNGEIRFGIEQGHNPNAIRINISDNANLYVQDFARGLKKYDLFSYIMKVRNLDFRTVLSSIKQVVGIDSYSDFCVAKSIFGGFYEKIKRKTPNLMARVYPESILEEYEQVYNTRFLRDNINFQAQDFFEIGYDVLSQRITIPIRNTYGELIGVKGRANWECTEDESKYIYLVPCPMSTTLYGYIYNYEFINSNKTILIGESEKFVMQAYSYGIRNCLALGGNSLSDTQCKILMELNPKEIVFILDKSLDPAITLVNAEKLSRYIRLFDTKIYWWDWQKNKSLPPKSSPSDYGKEVMNEILKKEIFEVRLNE